MTYKDTEILIQKYLNGETTAEEERQLALEVSREDAPDDWKVIAEMLGELTVDEALFDQMMEERSRKSRIVKLWPWVAAACVAALLIVFLSPPKENVSSQPQIAKVAKGQKQEPLPSPPKGEGQQKEKPIPTLPRGAKILERPVRQVIKKNVSKSIIKDEKEPVKENATLRPVEEGDIVPYEDPMMQFAEQARALRERGNRVIQRVSMNCSYALNNTSITPDIYPLNDL
ncbi:MAG: hypothetical protein IKH99_00455 [Prevotella sp.]|nr:hypothetical protein [Prevotella sp.]